MYQSLEPEPEGAIFQKRSMPQDMHSSPHDTDTSIAYWLETNIQGRAAQGRSLVSGRTVHANLNCYRTVNSRFRAVFGLGVFTNNQR